MSTTPLTDITNPPRCPLGDPISTFIDESETPPTTVPTPLSRQQGQGGDGRVIANMLGNVARRFPSKPKERGTRVTLPWLRWFNFVDQKIQIISDGGGGAGTGEVLFINNVLIGNVGGGEDALRNYTVASTVLFPTGSFKVVDVSASFRQATNANTKTIRLYVQSSLIALIQTADANLTVVHFRARFLYPDSASGPASLRYNAVYVASSNTGTTHTRQFDSDIVDQSLDLDLAFTGAATANDDIQQSSMVVTAFTQAA